MKKIYNIAIIIILAFGIFLRIYPLNFPFSHDEWYTYDIVNRGFVDMNIQMYNDVHVPLYFYLAKIFTLLFGMSEINLRLLSVLFGLLGIIIFAKFCMTFFNKRITILGTAITSLSIFHVSYSQIARMYSLLFLLASASLYFLFSLLFKKKKYSRLGYIFVNLGILYTHIFGVFLLFFNVVILYRYRKKIIDLRNTIRDHLIILVGALPVWLFIGVQILRKMNGTSYGNWMPPTKLSDIYSTFAALSSNDILVIPFLILFIYFIINHFCQKNCGGETYMVEEIIIIGLVICFVLPSIITLISPLFAWRYFFIVYPIFILCICLMFERISSQYRPAYLLLVFATLVLLGMSDITDINKKNSDQIKEQMCLQSVKTVISKYQKLDTILVSSRWLNEWVPNHRSITGAHKRLREILGTDTLLVNDYNTDLTPQLEDHEYILNISPSEWGETFIKTDNLKLIARGDCYGYHYRIYKK